MTESNQTLLTAEEKTYLIPDVLSRADLNIFEAENILQARKWALQKSVFIARDIFCHAFFQLLHKRMFNEVWRWAGTYRHSDKNIGVAYHQIQLQLQQLIGNVDYWQQHNTYNATEIAVISHHQLVKIHPFTDGNGRHARLFADVVIAKDNGNELTWGRGSSLTTASTIRQHYINALRKADNGSYADLIVFAQS